MSVAWDGVIAAIEAFLRILELALSGDKRSQERLKDILPPEQYTAMVRRSEALKDEEKFGPRG